MVRQRVSRDTMAMFGGPVPHFGTSAPKGTMRILFFGSFELPDVAPYDVDDQIMSYMLLLESWCWRECLVEAYTARADSRGRSAARAAAALRGRR